MRCVLSFDIGGTSLKGALINAQGEIVALDFLKQRPPFQISRVAANSTPNNCGMILSG